MNRKVKVFALLALVMITLVIVVFIAPAKMDAVNKGRWVYDAQGNHIGCKSPGNDCTWSRE